MKKANQTSLLTGILLFYLPFVSPAISGDTLQPVHIEAESLEIRDTDNISIYSGNVRLVQGSLNIQSNKMTLHFDTNDNLVLLEMIGSPTTLQQLNGKGQKMRGQADKLDYHKTQSLLILKGNAQFENASNFIEGNIIQINTETDHIEASGSEPADRVRMVIQPKPRQ